MDARTGRLRITDAERAEAVTSLGEHYAVGRLTMQEYDDRAGNAWRARTRADLDPLFADLPSLEPVRRSPSKETGWHERRPWQHVRWPVPVVPVIIVLVVLTVLTHLPIILFGLLAWFCLGRLAHRRW